MIWWAGMFAVVVVVALWLGRRDWRAGAIAAGVAGGYLPWFAFQERTIYSFYAVVFLPYVVLALTMSSTVLDRNAVQRDVAAQFEEREGVGIDLSCDDEMRVEEGATYVCTGTTADGEDVTLEIAVTDEDSAAYTWTEP